MTTDRTASSLSEKAISLSFFWDGSIESLAGQ